jgi:carboxymethylenebutenolidase
VTEIQRYLAEEIAEDHADGLVSRREALRRLGLLGLGGGAAASLLAGALVDRAKAVVGVSAGTGAETDRGAASDEVTARQTREITFRGPRGRRLLGAWAAARRPRGGVLVIHENRGLNDSIRSVAGRLAGSGYSSLAIDLLSEEAVRGRSPTSSKRWPRSERLLRRDSWRT